METGGNESLWWGFLAHKDWTQDFFNKVLDWPHRWSNGLMTQRATALLRLKGILCRNLLLVKNINLAPLWLNSTISAPLVRTLQATIEGRLYLLPSRDQSSDNSLASGGHDQCFGRGFWGSQRVSDQISGPGLPLSRVGHCLQANKHR